MCNVDIKKGDARRLDIEPGRVTLFLANLPFGKQFGTTDSNPTLYRKILADALRIGVPGRWQGIYLTSDDESFRTASREVPGINVEIAVPGEGARRAGDRVPRHADWPLESSSEDILQSVSPAKAGVQGSRAPCNSWIPAFAGTTIGSGSPAVPKPS